jgi:hypothetical protein
MVINSCTFDHSGGLHDRLGLQVGNHLTPTWIQLGGDIDGEVAGDRSGTLSLSSDGTTVAIGAMYNGGNGIDSGHVRVYKYIDSEWIKLGGDIDGEAAGDRSGASVSLSSDGTTVAIGAQFNNENGVYSGHVRVYKYIDSEWIKLGGDIDGEVAEDRSGTLSLSSDGTTVAIGARFNNENGDYSGHVRVYKYIDSEWIKLGGDIDGEAAGDNSGTSVSLSSDGTTVAIGATFNNGNGDDSGHVRVYKYIDSEWIKLGGDIDGEAAYDRSGWSVSLNIDGTTVAIGAAFNDGNGSNSGHVRVYKYIDSEWIQLGGDIDGEVAGDRSGTLSLSSDGTTVAIGAPINNENGDYSGHVRVYKYIGSEWIQLGIDIDGEAAGDYSGTSVSLSSDGNTVAIGAPFNNGNGDDSGHVRVYNLSQMQNADINGFFKSDISIPPYSVTPSDTSSTSGYIFPTNLLNTVYSIPYRYSRFWFTSDSDTTKAGWDITLSYFS